MRNGKCLVCGETWIGLSEDAYTSATSRHIIRHHRDEPLDKVLVEDFDDDEERRRSSA